MFAVGVCGPQYGDKLVPAQHGERRLSVETIVAVQHEDDLHPGIEIAERVQHFTQTGQYAALAIELPSWIGITAPANVYANQTSVPAALVDRLAGDAKMGCKRLR